MDHRAFIATLSHDEIRHLTVKSNRAGLIHLALHGGAIAAVGALIIARVPGWPLLMVVQGILVVFLFTLFHETMHETPFRSRHLNTGVSYVCGFALLIAPRWFRYFHLAHHRHTQDPENDPELAIPKPTSVWQYIVYMSGLPLWVRSVQTILRNARGRCRDPFVPVARRSAVHREARSMIAGYAALLIASITLQAPQLIDVWILPALLGQPFLRLYLLAEHGRCPHVTNMFENTRTTFTTWLVRRLAWNMPYHAEHHAYPTVPFHRLPELHKLANEHLRVTECGYHRFHRKYLAGLG